MTSLPSFNPNAIAGADAAQQRRRRASMSSGSTFKPLAVAAAIDPGTIT